MTKTFANWSERGFLFLQGLATPFFNALGCHLRERGARTLRINFCPGDRFYWHGPAVNFRGTREALPAFYEELFADGQFTDLILFGDTRAVHVPALDVAASRGCRVHVFEEGYLRPFWITLERNGVNARSSLPRDPAWYGQARRMLGKPAEVTEERTRPFVRAAQDMAFHLANVAAPLLYPRYSTHRPRAARHPDRPGAGFFLSAATYRRLADHQTFPLQRHR